MNVAWIKISQHIIGWKQNEYWERYGSPVCQINLSTVARQSLHCLFSEEGKHYTVIIGFSQRFTGGQISHWFTGGADKRQFHTTRVFCFLNIERSSVFFCVLRYVHEIYWHLIQYSYNIQYAAMAIQFMQLTKNSCFVSSARKLV